MGDIGVKTVCFRLPYDMYKKMKHITVEEDTNMTEYVKSLIEKDLKRREKKNENLKNRR